MPFETSRLHEFRGERLSLRAISRITGISRDTLQQRVDRGRPLDVPLRKSKRKPHLTGDWQRDVEMIVRWMHQRFLRSREAKILRESR